MGDFQDLDHIDGLSVSTTCANLYSEKRDDLVMFYFRKGAKSCFCLHTIKINFRKYKMEFKNKKKKIKALLVNTRNANAFTGKDGFKGLKILAEDLSEELTKKQNEDEDKPKKIEQDEILFACTGTIGESFPTEKIKKSIPEFSKKN